MSAIDPDTEIITGTTATAGNVGDADAAMTCSPTTSRPTTSQPTTMCRPPTVRCDHACR